MHKICDQAVEECELSIIDILHHPEVADQQNILATPTLVREIPLPVQRIVGDFSNRALVMNTLGLHPIRGLKTGKLDKAK